MLAACCATVSISCESCNKKSADADARVATSNDTIQVSADNDATLSSDLNAAETKESPANSAPAGSSAKGASAAKGSNEPNKSGYSAPDGTDAENNDGDQYTRNDATPKPTGPPIK